MSVDLHEITVDVEDTKGDMLLHSLRMFFFGGVNNFDMAVKASSRSSMETKMWKLVRML